jgi:hypothetical protein
MNSEFKLKLSHLTIGVITVAMAVIILWFIIFIVQTTFKLTVFAERTTEFFFVIIAAALAIIACAAFLSISLNISLIAEAKVREIGLDVSRRFDRKVFLVMGIATVALVAFLFVGDYLSREQQKRRLITESGDLVQKYSASVDDLSACLRDTSRIVRIPSILKFLSSQKSDFSDISLIVKSQFDGQPTFLHVTSSTYDKSLKEPYFNSAFYRSTKEDADYLLDVFDKQRRDVFVWSDKADHYLYFPIVSNDMTIVLRFSKYTRYGKIGS